MKNNQYPSKYSNGKEVSAAQYITELICENKAKLDGEDLHFRFWVHSKWEKFFKNQIASANKLLKKYDIIPIIRALKSSRGKRIYSLRAPHLPEIIEQEAKKYEIDSKKEVEIQRIENPKRQTKKSKQNIFSKLKDIDNGN
jgi:hypothetical protein